MAKVSPEISGIGEDGNSGQTQCQRFRFAFCLQGIFAGVAILTFARDFYVVELGAPAATIGIILTAHSFVAPWLDTIAGYLQDMEVLVRCFPKVIWGRRAPWMVLGLATCALSCCLMYLPPITNSEGTNDKSCVDGETTDAVKDAEAFQVWIYAWFYFLLLLGQWSFASGVISWGASRAEIYPYKEERIVVEGFAKLSTSIGVAVGAVLVLVILADPQMSTRLVVSVLMGIQILSSLWGTKIMKQAQQPTSTRVQSFWKEAREVLGQGAFRHLLVTRFLQGCHESVTFTFLLSYLTYVLKLSGQERSFIMALGGMISIACELLMSLVWSNIFNKRSGRCDMQYVTGFLRILNAPIAATLTLAGEPGVVKFIAYFVSSRLCFSPWTFWRISAQNWVVDEDCQNHEGLRRESTFWGIQSALVSLARNLIAALLFMGLGHAGLVTMNCSERCDAEACYKERYERQPESVRIYLLAMYGIVCPALELLCGVCCIKFPIHGERLCQLYKRQATTFKVTAWNKGAQATDTSQAQETDKEVLKVDSVVSEKSVPL